MRRAVLAIAALALAGGVAAQAPGLADQRQRLADAKRGAKAAADRADRLTAQAGRERDAAERARMEERALAARVASAEADLTAAQARVTIVDRLLSEQRARLGAAQTPVARLLAALESLSRRPPVVAIAQPGSVDDLVHVRAVLGSALPVVRLRTEAVRGELDRARRLQASAQMAAGALRDGRVRLEHDRIALARLEADHRRRSTSLGRDAMSESDRALALGERARDLVDALATDDLAQATAAELAALPGPAPRPIRPDAVPEGVPAGVYRLPVRGRLITGFDEVSDAGVRSRGLTMVTRPSAEIVAPAGGVVRYARPFRDYGTIVIIDHGAGWTSLITGLASTRSSVGSAVRQGTVIGRAMSGEEPRVTVELRRHGRPVDAATLIG